MGISLPTQQRTKALRTNPRFLLLYGPPKVGKTEILAELVDNLILDIEDGSDFLEKGLIIKPKNWGQVEEVGEQILESKKQTGKFPYSYLSLDTATQLEEWADGLGKKLYLQAPSAGKKYIDNPALLPSIKVLPGKDGGYGPGYNWLRIAYGMCISYLRKLAPTLILIAHVKDKDLVDKEGNEINSSFVMSRNLDLTGKLKAITCSKADAIGYLYRKVGAMDNNGESKEDLWVNFRGLEIAAGSRSKHLVNQDMKFDWGKIFLPESEEKNEEKESKK